MLYVHFSPKSTFLGKGIKLHPCWAVLFRRLEGMNGQMLGLWKLPGSLVTHFSLW